MKFIREYVENIDIGMMQNIHAHLYGSAEINESSKILLWTMNYASYEACPYYYAEIFLGTYVIDNKVVSCALLGEVSGGGDAPYWSDVMLTSEMDKEGFRTLRVSRSGGEEDEDGNELVENSKTDIYINITPEGFVVEK